MANILIVDDEPSVVLLIKFIMETLGHRVREAYNGEEAVKLLGIEPVDPSVTLPDLVILDVMMPIMDGHTVCLKMKNDPRTSNIPVLIVSAKGDMRQLFQAVPTVTGFFSKPFDPRKLKDAVEKALVQR
ncbi:MAG: response regulator [Elusimicrobia bacterium]|nr:response regulator [Elusimicrobiota bacterium]